MHLQAFDVFGARPGAGNPALVVEHDGLDAAGRLRLACERGVTCVFLDAAGAVPTLDFWYPHQRSPLCVHATLAAARVLFDRQGGAAPIEVATALPGPGLTLLQDDDEHYVALRPQAAPDPGMALPQLRQLLRAPGLVPLAPPRVASVGSPKLLVEVADAATLHALAPDLEAIVLWGRAHGVNGLYVYCRSGDGTCEGRNFNHLEAHLEDSATGVAAGALTLLLGEAIVLRQGRATGRDCLIRTRINGNFILVGGAVAALTRF